MPNPFPGMNPYLEARWRGVDAGLMVYIRDGIQDSLPAQLYADIDEEVVIDEGDTQLKRRPDVYVHEDPAAAAERRGGVATLTAAQPLVAAEPVLVLAEPEQVHRHIEICDSTSGDRVVTAIEVLSPTNKIGTADRRRYREKQAAYVAGGVNIVEIDLVRDGEYNLAAPLARIPPSKRTPCAICVSRGARPMQFEYYPAPLRERLPVIPIPLRETDQDVLLDLQPLIDLCYDRGRYSRIDYRMEPEPPLDPADAAWADALLREKGLRL